jgi:hypothetical protein
MDSGGSASKYTKGVRLNIANFNVVVVNNINSAAIIIIIIINLIYQAQYSEFQ